MSWRGQVQCKRALAVKAIGGHYMDKARHYLIFLIKDYLVIVRRVCLKVQEGIKGDKLAG